MTAPSNFSSKSITDKHLIIIWWNRYSFMIRALMCVYLQRPHTDVNWGDCTSRWVKVSTVVGKKLLCVMKDYWLRFSLRLNCPDVRDNQVWTTTLSWQSVGSSSCKNPLWHTEAERMEVDQTPGDTHSLPDDQWAYPGLFSNYNWL